MTRATNFALVSAALTFVYLVFLFGILPVPLLSKSVAGEILPTVRRPTYADPVVGPGEHRLLSSLQGRLGPLPL